MRPRQFSENLKFGSKISLDIVEKYREYVRFATKNYTLTDEELDAFVENWNENFDIRQMSLSLVAEDEPDPTEQIVEDIDETKEDKDECNSGAERRISITKLSANKGILEPLNPELIQVFLLVTSRVST